jgi:hypothetical protein
VNYLNLDAEMLNADPFSDATVRELGVWVRVLCHCVKQENNGHLTGAKGWSNSKWMSKCGVEKRDVDACNTLFVREADDITIIGYPVEAENKRQAQSEGGKKGAVARWAKYKAMQQPNDLPNGLPIDPPNGLSDSVKEGKERKGKGEGSEATPTDLAFEILTEREELRALSLPQWVKIRQAWQAHPKFKTLDWPAWAKKTADAAVIFGQPELVGPWVAKRLGEALEGGGATQKNTTGAPIAQPINFGPPAGEA